jgi:hypothetical protein
MAMDIWMALDMLSGDTVAVLRCCTSTAGVFSYGRTCDTQAVSGARLSILIGGSADCVAVAVG